jgi:outer membrane factor, OMF family
MTCAKAIKFNLPILPPKRLQADKLMQGSRMSKLSHFKKLAIACCSTIVLAPSALCSAPRVIADLAISSDPMPPLHPAITPDSQVVNQLDSIAREAQETEGALFVKPDELKVKAPLLKALIELHNGLSPYQLDAEGSRVITLRGVLLQALSNNLDIKISNSDMQTDRWQFIGSFGNFLPTIQNQVNYQSLSGSFASPFGTLSPVNSAFLTIPSGLQWTLFSGGANYYTTRRTKHEFNAGRFDLQRTTNDILLDGARLYYDLVLQDVLLQIRIKAVQTSEALVAKNQIQYQFGANTQLDVLQAQTQLARDRQALISQQVARRKAAVSLATTLNADLDVDMMVADRTVSKVRLVDDIQKVTELVQIAIDNRPELKKWEQMRLAAKDAIHVAFAPLLPHVIGQAGLATTGAKVATSSSTSNAASTAGTGGLGITPFGPTSVVPVGTTIGPKKFSLAEIYLIGISVQWNIGGLGVTDTANVNAARWQARKAQTEFARELTFVCREVRDAYLDSIDADNLINATTDEVNSAREQLKVAVIRLEEGVGEDLDVVNAQRNYTDSLISKANAIIKFNQSQISLLRAMGRISVDTITSPKLTLH